MTLTIIEFGMIQIKDLLTFRINFLRPNWYQGNWIIGLEMASILMTLGRKRPPPGTHRVKRMIALRLVLRITFLRMKYIVKS